MENNLIDLKNNQTMSSLEIAELTGKRHNNVLRKCRELQTLKIIGSAQSEHTSSQNGQIYPIFYLDKTESLNLVANLSPKFTSKVIDRWQELESQVARVLSSSEMFLQSAQLIIDLEKEQLRVSDKVDTFDKRVDKVEQIIGEKASNDKSPEPGYFSIGTLQLKLSEKFPKIHTKGLTVEAGTSVKIRSCECYKYISSKNVVSEYIAYNFNDIDSVIDDLIATGVRVGKTQKIKSPLYGSAFKHPMN